MSNEPYIINHFISKKQALQGQTNLSLFIENDLFMFAVFSQKYEELIELCKIIPDKTLHIGKHSLESLKFLVNNFGLTEKRFDNIIISVLNTNFTILPEAFAVNNSKDILEFSSGHDAKNILTHHFNNLSFNYFIDSELIKLLEKTFKKATIKHAGAVSINLLFNNRSLKKADLFLNFNEGIFELLARENNNLLYYNVFHYETNEDVMYFLLFMMEQFDLDAGKIKLVVAGQMELESDIYKALKKYIKHISFAVNEIKSDALTEIKIPNHFYFTLLNQHLCEL